MRTFDTLSIISDVLLSVVGVVVVVDVVGDVDKDAP